LLLDDVVAWQEMDIVGPSNTARLRAIVRNLPMLDRGITVTWSKKSGPGTISFDNPEVLETNATFSESGAYTLQVTIDDGNTQVSNTIAIDAGVWINPGLNDAWYDPMTDGQGFFITVFPDLGAVSLAWFTYDTELPPEEAVANLGDPGHRWLTAVGPIDGNQSVMNIEMTSGGIFDTATIIERTDPPGSDGTITLTFDSCNSGTVEYDIPSINRQGIVPIVRVANDNIVICEALGSN